MARLIQAERGGRMFKAWAWDLYRLLGVKALPVEGMPERLIQGVRVYVRPLPAKVGARRNFQGLRVMAICECGKHVAVGRLHQHKCKSVPVSCPACGAPSSAWAK